MRSDFSEDCCVADGVFVGPGSPWANPYTPELMAGRIKELQDALGFADVDLDADEMAVEAFRSDLTYGPDSVWWWFGPHQQMLKILAGLDELRGKDLVCWCAVSDHCHADVLLEVANSVV